MARQQDLELPEWLIDLLAGEDGPIDQRSVKGRMAAAGVTEVSYLGFPGSPDALVARGPGLDVVVEVVDQAAPVTTALEELVTFLKDFGALRQLHSADQDMDLVAYTARELAESRDDEDVSNPLLQHDQVLETGLITMYARSFTGKARLGETWLPPAGPSRDLHHKIIRLRNTVYAHADWTASRTIVDTNAMLGLEGPPILAEQRSSLSRQELLDIAELAEAQQVRFNIASGEMKRRLGAANVPPPDDA
jgi:hypothetical protein